MIEQVRATSAAATVLFSAVQSGLIGQ